MKDEKPLTVNPDGTMHVPGAGKLPMVGVDPALLAQRQKEHQQRMAIIQRQMRSTYKCTQCKQTYPGRDVLVARKRVGGVMTEVLVCPDRKCMGAVILHQDALSLVKPPQRERN